MARWSGGVDMELKVFGVVAEQENITQSAMAGLGMKLQYM